MVSRPHPLSLRLKEEEKQLLQQAADKVGMTRNAFIRLAAWKHVNQLVTEGKLPSEFARF